MPQGKAIEYKQYGSAALKAGIKLKPPTEAVRVLLFPEFGPCRYVVDNNGHDTKLSKDHGFPLLPDWYEEFDRDLQNIRVVAAVPDAQLSVYYFGS